MAFTLPELHYAKSSLVPHISGKTMDIHYGKHHKAYIDKLNGLIFNTSFDKENVSLERVMRESYKNNSSIPNKEAVFNNSAQAWNHGFYWHCMQKDGGKGPHGEASRLIKRDFGNYERFRQLFHAQGMEQFGSGWIWLVVNNDKLEIVKTANAHNPLVENMTPILVADVWEHAYYLDYQNKRTDYLTVFLDCLVSWDFVNYNISNV